MLDISTGHIKVEHHAMCCSIFCRHLSWGKNKVDKVKAISSVFVYCLTQRKFLTFGGLPKYDAISQNEFCLIPSSSYKNIRWCPKTFSRVSRGSQRFSTAPRQAIMLCATLLSLQKFCCIARCLAACRILRTLACKMDLIFCMVPEQSSQNFLCVRHVSNSIVLFSRFPTSQSSRRRNMLIFWRLQMTVFRVSKYALKGFLYAPFLSRKWATKGTYNSITRKVGEIVLFSIRFSMQNKESTKITR